MRNSSILFAISALALAAAALAEPTVELSTGLDYREGDYGTGESIETWEVPTSLRVQSGQVIFSATLPYLRVDAPGNVVGGGGGILGLPIIVDPTEPPGRVRREGIGDLELGAAYTIPRVTPFVGVGYTMPGDPDQYDLGNSLSARAGAAVQMGKRVRGHVTYGYAESISPLIPDEQQISTGINAGLSDRLSLGLYGAAGLSKGSPDVGAGVRLGTSF